MVSIFTYRDERKLFAALGAVIVAALIALMQLDAAKTGKPSLLTVAVASSAVIVQSGVAATGNAFRSLGGAVANAPRLAGQNAALRAKNRALRAENDRLREALAVSPGAEAIVRLAAREPRGIEASAVGYDPENVTRSITLDRGSQAGVARDDGVIDADGVVGRVVAVTPATSTVLLLTDGASKVPAVVQRGRWWGIATGTNVRVRLQYVSQDARLKVGDVIVTGAGRSFRAGLRIGTIAALERHPEGALYQTAVVEPAVAFGRLSHVVVVPRSER